MPVMAMAKTSIRIKGISALMTTSPPAQVQEVQTIPINWATPPIPVRSIAPWIDYSNSYKPIRIIRSKSGIRQPRPMVSLGLVLVHSLTDLLCRTVMGPATGTFLLFHHRIPILPERVTGMGMGMGVIGTAMDRVILVDTGMGNNNLLLLHHQSKITITRPRNNLSAEEALCARTFLLLILKNDKVGSRDDSAKADEDCWRVLFCFFLFNLTV
jgi:hypothetical protein